MEVIDLCSSSDSEVEEIKTLPSKKRKTSTKRKQKYPKRDQYHCTYLLRLQHPNRNLSYNGSTQEICKRLAQHNMIIAFKDGFTRRNTDKGKWQWQPICVIHGPTMTKKMSLQLEYAIKRNKKVNPRNSSRVERAKFREDGKQCHPLVKRAIAVLNFPRWSSKSPPSDTVPLTVTWYLHDEKPHSEKPYLPPHIKEDFGNLKDLYSEDFTLKLFPRVQG